MIGFQCAPATGASKPADQQQQAPSSAASSPASRRSSASSSSSSSSSSAASSPNELAGRLAGHLHHQLPSIQQHNSHSQLHSPSSNAKTHDAIGELSEERELVAASPAVSPGYHSAAPSPGGSTSSSIASPISSSASTSSTSVCSSSGISTASLLSAASTHSSLGLLQQQQQSPITTTASSTHRPTHQQHHQLQPPSGKNVAPNQMSQQLAAPHMQQHTGLYAPMVRTQQHQQQQQRHNNQQQQANGLGALLDHFPQTHREPLNLSWFHEANNRAALNAALSSTKLIVAGDISLAEMSRYPVPIMARPPLGVSDLTLENWITDVLQARKGIKLTFTSTRTVEPAFRVLARHADQLRGPLVLSADVLARPQTGASQAARNQTAASKQLQQPVDAWTFLMLCRTRFPKSIISIGWCGGSAGPSLGSPCESAAPDSTICQPESMFELDLLEQHNQHQFSSPILHLSQAGRAQHQQPMAFQPHPALLNRQLLQGRLAQFGNSSCPSNGSLNSSSGNSSGSPSPTSPLGSSSLFGSAGSQNQAQRQRHHQRHLHPIGNPAGSSAEQLIMAAAAAAAVQDNKSSASPSNGHLKGGWSAMAAAAMVAQLQQQQQQDQLPLNLNINEAAESQQAVASLQELAQTIQQLQQQSSSLESLSTSLQQQQESSKATAATLALASNILQANAGNPHTGHAHQLLVSQLREAQKWEHVNKKAAVSNRLNSNSPSPISTSPKQQPASAINLLSCVSSGPNKALGRAPSGHLNQHQQHIRIAPQQQQPEAAGYTREMIDKMSSLVKEYNLTQAITFPVEARWLVRRHSAHFAHSLSELQRLLFQVGPNSTLTLIAQPEDLISADELQLIRKHFSPNQILFDLPGELAQAAKQHELATSGGDR